MKSPLTAVLGAAEILKATRRPKTASASPPASLNRAAGSGPSSNACCSSPGSSSCRHLEGAVEVDLPALLARCREERALALTARSMSCRIEAPGRHRPG
ncbi:MAG: hypothetical protein IPM73_03065 [Betaproteobacteria bacterium]|nr:hypothetical protein [Betaproteobacteria bacterium]